MWKLFKEVFKSLSKIKVSVIGLTLLIFLTSGVFTLMYDVSKSMSTQFKKYTQRSKLQDFTIDLNLPTNGNAYNGGFYINNLDQNIENVSQNYNKPILYFDPKDYIYETKILNLNNEPDKDFIKLSRLNVDDINLKDKYILKSELLKFYSINPSGTNKSIALRFVLDDINNPYMITSDNVKFSLYEKNNNNEFKKIYYRDSFNKDALITFDDSYKLNELMNLSFLDNKTFADQISSVYINLKTKEATFDISKGKVWLTEGYGYLLDLNEFAAALNFDKTNNSNEYLINLEKIKQSKIIDLDESNPLKSTIKKSINLSLIHDQDIIYDSQGFYEISGDDTIIKIPKSWVSLKRNEKEYERFNYKITYDDKNKDKWTGSYKIYIENLIRENGEIPANIKDFSFWRIKSANYLTIYDDQGQKIKEELKDSVYSPLIEEDLKTKVNIFAKEKQIPAFDYDYYKMDEPQTIEQISGLSLSNLEDEDKRKEANDKILNIYNNSRLKDDVFNEIKINSLKISKQLIIDQVKKLIGPENIGYRKSITVDSFDQNSSKRNVFNFVDTGNEENIVNGVEINVGRLFNYDQEYTKNPLYLNFEDYNKFFRTKQLPPKILEEIIKEVSFNFTTDSKILELDIRYGLVNIKDPSVNSVNVFKNAKILLLSDYIEDEENNLDKINIPNSYGLYLRNDNEIYLVKSVGSVDDPNSYWENLRIPNLNKPNYNSKEIFELLLNNNWTIKIKSLNTQAWAEVNRDFSHLHSLKLGFREISTDIVNEAINYNTLNLLMNTVESILLESDLHKKGYLSKESISEIMKAGKKASEDNNLSGLLSSGLIDLSILPLIGYDVIYNLTHSENGNYLPLIISELFSNIEKRYSTVSLDDTEQRKWLRDQLQNLVDFLKDFAGVDIPGFIDLDLLVNSSKNPRQSIKEIGNLILSVDFKTFSEKYKEYQKLPIFKKGSIAPNLILILIVDNIDQNQFKKSINNIIDLLDKNIILNVDNKNSIVNLIFNLLPDNLREGFKQIFIQLNAYKNEPEKAYDNILNGVKYFVNYLDFKEFTKPIINQLEEAKITNKFDFNSNDIFKNLLIALFSNSGSDRTLKNELVKILNLSDKGYVLKVNENLNFSLPAPDEDKLDFYDFLSILSAPNNQQNETESTQVDSNTNDNTNKASDSYIVNTLLKISKIKQIIDNLGYYDYDSFNYENKLILNNFYKINEENKGTKELIDQRYQELINLFDIFKFDPNKGHNLNEHLSLGNLADLYLDFENTQANSIWNQIHKVLKTLVVNKDVSSYKLGEQIFPLLSIFSDIFALKTEVSWEQKYNFAIDLLKLANNKNVTSFYNDAKLFDSRTNNLPLHEQTDFYLTRSIADPFMAMINFFKKDENNQYTNKELNDFVKKHSIFKDWIEDNKKTISDMLALANHSNKYYYFTENELNNLGLNSDFKGLYSQVAFNFINSLNNNQTFKDNVELFSIVTSNLKPSKQINSFIQIDLLLNPISLSFMPDLILWLVSDTNGVNSGDKNKANIASLFVNKTINYENLIKSDDNLFYEWINSFSKSHAIEFSNNTENIKYLTIDHNFLEFLSKKASERPNGYKFFDIDLNKFIIEVINKITDLKFFDDFIKINSPSSYVARVNYAYLFKNHKKIYDGLIPNDPYEIEKLLRNIPQEYLIDVNGIKFIIVGEDITADYLYPVVDEANVQVNTQDQAIVYVNTQGFDRVRYSYQGNNVKEYLLLKTDSLKSETPAEIKNTLKDYVFQATGDNGGFERVFGYNELDLLNPERSLRITVIEGLLKSVISITTILLLILIVLIASSITFIVKRYISNKNKVLGILLAQGYSRLQISLSFTVFAFFTALIGGVSGYLVGFGLHGPAMTALSDYWTLPIETVNFTILSFFLTVLFPFLGMSILIVLISLISLKHKSIDLMSGQADIKIGNFKTIYQKQFNKKNVKTRFAASLFFNSFWKLVSFSVSIILTSFTIIFGLSTFNVFTQSVDKTYENRSYIFKYDLETPTYEGGAIHRYNASELENSLYFPLGNIVEAKRNFYDYFKPGNSRVINAFEGANGYPDEFTSHIISQFSPNVKIDGPISIDPWSIAYNSMPDSQKARINQIRDKVGYELTKTQEGVVYSSEDPTKIDFSKIPEGLNFFAYVPNKVEITKSKFIYFTYDHDLKQWKNNEITTSKYRNEYRKFLLDGYKKMHDRGDFSEFFISFGGIYFNKEFDEVYTYISGANKKDEIINIYGYKPDSKMVKLIGNDNQDWLKELNDIKYEQTKDEFIPVVINVVAQKKFNIGVGSKFELKITNNIDRYRNKLLDKNIEHKVTFKVIGINPTYINVEFLTAKKFADEITGLNKLNYKDNEVFNGILSTSADAKQLAGSTSLYSISGYWPALSSFDVSSFDMQDKREVYENIFGKNGSMVNSGFSLEEIKNFLSNNPNNTYEDVYSNGLTNPETHINKFAQVYDNKLLIPTANKIDSRDIEIGYTKTISQTVEKIVTAIVILTLSVTVIILVVLSNIIVAENEKNIAILTILGYTQKEKVKIFFSIFLPFILISIFLAIPFTLLIINAFSALLIAIASIALPISLTALNVGLTFIIVFLVFAITSAYSWWHINKIKAIDLLKGK
ncbi:FtsX-like permease family protein [Mycoplasmopsis ciconiae]|uniref:FtsX-like permease family protein n=1 Tax=Mycoplasmopsis ciconiae TaxID=561067 RepID=A0ABU7ML64_9BACT|nr:FtsX-like permease family protein [Mycoplasmopsis ciconiae]